MGDTAAPPESAILVTGGAGFLGNSFVRLALQDPQWRVVNLDRLTYASHRQTLQQFETHPRHVFVHGDIGDRCLVRQLLEQYSPRAVVNFAAETHVDRSIDDPRPFLEANVLALQSLLAESLIAYRRMPPEDQDAFRFMQISTDEVYGSIDHPRMAAVDSAFCPSSPYAASKAAADHLVGAYRRSFGLPAMRIHCSNNYGPYQFPEKLVPLTIHQLLEGRPVRVYGDGQQQRDWIYVDDCCRAILAALRLGQPGSVFHAGTGTHSTNIDLVRQLCRLVDQLASALPVSPAAQLIQFVVDRPGHDRRYAMDTSKTRRELSWSPATTLQQGLRTTVQWYLDHRDWMTAVMQGRYDGRRLGIGGKRL